MPSCRAEFRPRAAGMRTPEAAERRRRCLVSSSFPRRPAISCGRSTTRRRVSGSISSSRPIGATPSTIPGRMPRFRCGFMTKTTRSTSSSRPLASGRSTACWQLAIVRRCWRRGRREALRLPGNSPEAVLAASSKLGSRERFAAAGLTTPWFLAVPEHARADVFAQDARLRYPCVVKPTSLSGSRGVIRADGPEQCAAAIDRIRALLARPAVRALRHPGGQQIIVEGFIEGREYAVEGVLSGGQRSIAGDLRQTGSARWSVFRRDHLRHTAAAR